MANTILVIGLLGDPHIDEVEKHITALDCKATVVLFNPFLDGYFIEINAGNVSELTSSCLFVVDGQRIAAESIRSVWYNLKPRMTRMLDEDLQGHIANDFAEREWEKALRSLESYLSHARWLNPMAGSQLSKCMPYQLLLAQQVGLTVPRTTITNNPAAVEKILDKADHGRVVFKTMSPLFVAPDKTVRRSTEITKEFLSVSRASVGQCPAIYQELLQERRSDLRINVVGRSVFAIRTISTQKPDDKELYTEVQISESLKERLLEFHERAGLVYAAYNFLESEDDAIFLECDPMGAWICLERRLGLKVSEHVARYLLGRNEN